jgi:hypothetical protein
MSFSDLIKMICIIIATMVLVSGCLQQERSKAGQLEPSTDVISTSQNGELVQIPVDFQIYQDYIEKLTGKRGISETGTIEVTVLSINRTEICPYQEENCSIEAYPMDTGLVKIEKIIQYTPVSRQIEPGVEQTTEVSLENKTIVPGYKGTEYPSKSKNEYLQLKEGQEYQALFLITTRPVKIRYEKINGSENGRESVQIPDNNTKISHQSTPSEKTFKSIRKDGDYFVFTTKVGDFPTTIEKTFPGIEVGSRLIAEINFDGSLFIGEYEIKN